MPSLGTATKLARGLRELREDADTPQYLGLVSAGVILSTVPVAVLFSFLQRHLIHGLTAGAVKG